MTVTPEDIAAMKADGSIGEFFRHLAGQPAKKADPAAPAKPPVDIPRERPGAWPTGSQRPTPPDPIPGPAVQAAIDDYRRWYLAGRPPAPDRCPCTTCRRRNGELPA